MRSIESLTRIRGEQSVVDCRRTSYLQVRSNRLFELGISEMNLGERFGLLAVLLATAGGCSGMDPEEDTYNTVIRNQTPGGSGSTPGNGGTDQGLGGT